MFLAKKNETLPSKGKFVSVRFAELAQNESFTASLDRSGRPRPALAFDVGQALGLRRPRRPPIAGLRARRRPRKL